MCFSMRQLVSGVTTYLVYEAILRYYWSGTILEKNQGRLNRSWVENIFAEFPWFFSVVELVRIESIILGVRTQMKSSISLDFFVIEESNN
jgi:hypothetical protein